MLSLVTIALLAVAPTRDFFSEPPDVYESRESDGFAVEGAFSVLATPAVIWSVLTDYERLPLFTSALTKSTVRERRSGGVVLEQVAIAKLWLFSRTVHLLLDVREVREHALVFRDISGDDFISQEGSWLIRRQDVGCLVTYHMRAQPRMSVPDVIGKAVFKEEAVRLLAEIRDEINKRALLVGAYP